MSETDYILGRIKEISQCYRLLDRYLQEVNSEASEHMYQFKDWLLKQQYQQIQELSTLRH